MVTESKRMQGPSPIDVLDKAICTGFCDSMRRGPGQIVMRMSKEDREILSHLSSDDAKNMRPMFSPGKVK